MEKEGKKRKFMYNGNDFMNYRNGLSYELTRSLQTYIKNSPDEWEEVFEEEKELTFPRMMLTGNEKNMLSWKPRLVCYIAPRENADYPIVIMPNGLENAECFMYAKELLPVKTISIEEAQKRLSEIDGCEVEIEGIKIKED